MTILLKERSVMQLDAIDLKILELLQGDGRMSHTVIGREIGLTAPSVYARVQRLEREGIITGYTVLLDAERMGRGLTAFVRVGIQATTEEERTFEQFVLEEPQVVECFDVDGEETYLLKVRTASPQTLRLLLTSVRNLSGVTRTVTTIALATVKETQMGGQAQLKTKDGQGEDVRSA